MSETSIQWTDVTWNPMRGCSLISPGCRNCYAMGQAHRFNFPGGAYEGLTRLGSRGPRWSGKVIPTPRTTLEAPLRWQTAKMVFVNSMSDLFHESLSNEEIDNVFAVMALAPRHTFQVLTKRADRLKAYLADPERWSRVIGRAWEMLGHLPKYFHNDVCNRPWPLPNVWLGVSVESPDYLERIDRLKDAPAAVRFVSFEPLLEDLGAVLLDGIHWGIVGGESRGGRPCSVRWVRSLVEQCRAQGVVPFVKQLGSNVTWDVDITVGNYERTRFPTGNRDLTRRPDGTYRVHLVEPKGGDMAEWPEDLRVREFPVARP